MNEGQHEQNHQQLDADASGSGEDQGTVDLCLVCVEGYIVNVLSIDGMLDINIRETSCTKHAT